MFSNSAIVVFGALGVKEMYSSKIIVIKVPLLESFRDYHDPKISMAPFGVLPMVPLVILPMVPLVANGTIGLPMVPLAYQ